MAFTFLGYAFCPRQVKGKDGKTFTSFTPAMSPEALKAKSERVRGWRLHMRTGTGLDEPVRRCGQVRTPTVPSPPTPPPVEELPCLLNPVGSVGTTALAGSPPAALRCHQATRLMA